LPASISAIRDLILVRGRASKPSFIKYYAAGKSSANISIHNTRDLREESDLFLGIMNYLGCTEAALKNPVRDLNVTLSLWVVRAAINDSDITGLAK
jgi:uncharacterized protein YegJ (DUF2314 family)